MFKHAGHDNEIQLFSGHNQEGAFYSNALHLFALTCLPAQNVQCRLICGSGKFVAQKRVSLNGISSFVYLTNSGLCLSILPLTCVV